MSVTTSNLLHDEIAAGVVSDAFYAVYQRQLADAATRESELSPPRSGRLGRWVKRVIGTANRPESRERLTEMIRDMGADQRHRFAEAILGPTESPADPRI